MASGKAMANPDLGRDVPITELEAKLHEANEQLGKISSKVTDINKRLDKDPRATLWYRYISLASIGMVTGVLAGIVIWLISLGVTLLTSF